MKMTYVSAVLIFLFFFCAPLATKAQSDHALAKSAKTLFDKKLCDSAFNQLMRIKKVNKGKVQTLIKKTYPCLVSKNTREATALKLNDRDEYRVQQEKLVKMIGIIRKSRAADSLLELKVKPDVYKKLSRKKTIERTLKTYEAKLQTVIANIARMERLKKINDSLAVLDSIRQLHLADSLRRAEEARLARINDSLMSLEAEKSRKAKGTSLKDKYIQGDRDVEPKRYYIIAGSYKTEEEALKAVKKLKELGFKNAEPVNINPWGNLRICYNSYDTYNEALNDIDEIRANYRHDAWILKW